MTKTPDQCKRFILTGTPGSGKTTIIRELEKHADCVIDEAATDVIAKEQAKGIERPWEQSDFVDKIVILQVERQMRATGALQFYDRSPFCTYALGQYLCLGSKDEYVPSVALDDEIQRCLKNTIYQRQVFFFENLGFIENTDARKISYEEALIFEKIHLDVYNKFEFELIMIPKNLTIAERCEFILEKVR